MNSKCFRQKYEDKTIYFSCIFDIFLRIHWIPTQICLISMTMMILQVPGPRQPRDVPWQTVPLLSPSPGQDDDDSDDDNDDDDDDDDCTAPVLRSRSGLSIIVNHEMMCYKSLTRSASGLAKTSPGQTWRSRNG